MRRRLRAVAGVVLVIVASYAYSWATVYVRSATNYRDALDNLARGRADLAIKGGQVVDRERNTYLKLGGLQSVIEVWESPWAVPRPRLYRQAIATLDAAIERSLDAETGVALVRQYARLDRRFLDRIMFRVGALYEAAGRLEDARTLYEQAKALFPQDRQFIARVDERLRSLNAP